MKYLNISFVFACFILLLMACDDSNIFDDETPSPIENLSVIENMLVSSEEYEDFIKAITKAGLGNRLTNSGSHTILAPTKEAMRSYMDSKDTNPDDGISFSIDDIDGATLRSDFSYHVMNGIKKSSDFEGFGYVETISMEGPENNFLSFYFENLGSSMIINNTANVNFNDTELENGVIHSINTVLTPPNIMDLIEYNPEFERIGEVLFANDEQDKLRTGSQTTFFAPCNDAFPKLFAEYGKLDETELDEYLSESLLLHLISDTLIFSDQIEPGFLETSIGTNLSFQFDSTANEIYIRDFAQRNSYFKQTDIFARNGILHSIDNVLMKQEAP